MAEAYGSKSQNSEGVTFSFDLFDTLVTRSFIEPDHLHWMVGERMKESGLIAFEPERWRDLRIAAEATCAATNPYHDLHDIYAVMRETADLDQAASDEGLRTEFEEELRSLNPVLPAQRRFNRLIEEGRDVIILTDTYFDRPMITAIVEKTGCSLPAQNIFISCEIKKSKFKGDIFKYVRDQLQGRSGKVSHAGDNFRSDVFNAVRGGVHARWAIGTAPNRYERALLGRGPFDVHKSLIAGSARVARNSAPAGEDDIIWSVSTSVVGPVLFSFVLWMILDARQRGLKRLYFLARDGQILHKIACEICEWLAIKIECTYLLASRQALFVPSLPLDVFDAIDFVIGNGRGKPVGVVLREVDFTDSEIHDILRSYGGMQGDLLGTVTGSEDRLRRALQQPSTADCLRDRIRAQKEAFRAYFAAEGFLDPAPKAIVDLGWHGNLQLRIVRATEPLGVEPSHAYYFGLHVCPPEIAENVSKFSHLNRINQNLLETFCLAKHQSIRRYMMIESGPSGLGYDRIDEASAEWGVGTQQGGIACFTGVLIKSLDPALVDPELLLVSLRDSASAAFKLFTNSPSRAEAEVYGRFKHAQGQLHTDYHELAPPMKSASLVQKFLRKDAKRATLWFWGSVARSAHAVLPNLVFLAMNINGLGAIARPKRDLRVLAYKLYIRLHPRMGLGT